MDGNGVPLHFIVVAALLVAYFFLDPPPRTVTALGGGLYFAGMDHMAMVPQESAAVRNTAPKPNRNLASGCRFGEEV
ncbi:MAG: hypothetical protein ACOX7N_10635 [Lawsonibacter sp.]